MKIVLLTNILTPFRIFYYDMLYEEYNRQNIEFSVLVMVPNEPGRKWEYNDLAREYTTLLKGSLRKISGIDWIVNTDIEEKIAQKKPDIIICAGSYMNPSVWTALKLKKKYRYKVLFWSESHLNEKRNYSSAKLMLREQIRTYVLNKFDGFWYAGKMSKEFIDRYVKKHKKFIFVPNMIESDVYGEAAHYTEEMRQAVKEKYQLSADCRILLIPSRLSKEKGVLEFLELFSKSEHKNEALLAIAGEGPLEEQVRKSAETLNVNVRLLGFQNQKNMVELYAAADAFVMPSLSDANPLTVVEACWAKKPLLVSEHVGNYPETVVNGENGFVFSYKDVEGAIHSIDTILTADRSWLESAGEKSLKIAQEKYESHSNVKRVALETVNVVKGDFK